MLRLGGIKMPPKNILQQTWELRRMHPQRDGRYLPGHQLRQGAAERSLRRHGRGEMRGGSGDRLRLAPDLRKTEETGPPRGFPSPRTAQGLEQETQTGPAQHKAVTGDWKYHKASLTRSLRSLEHTEITENALIAFYYWFLCVLCALCARCFCFSPVTSHESRIPCLYSKII